MFSSSSINVFNGVVVDFFAEDGWCLEAVVEQNDFDGAVEDGGKALEEVRLVAVLNAVLVDEFLTSI